MLCVYAVCTKYNNINGTMINDAIFFTQNHAINIVIHIHTLLIFVWILCMYLLEFFFLCTTAAVRACDASNSAWMKICSAIQHAYNQNKIICSP